MSPLRNFWCAEGVPAPTNLVVPPHYYQDDNTLVIGVDPQGAA